MFCAIVHLPSITVSLDGIAALQQQKGLSIIRADEVAAMKQTVELAVP
jgi:hypothetical protein